MSQKKVDKYKEEKANRQHIEKKKKTVRRVQFIVVIAIIAGALVWFGVSVYNNSKSTESAGVKYIDSKAVVDYMNDPTHDITEDESAAEEEIVTDAEAEAASEGIDVEEAVIDETLDTSEQK